jgi:hypothetical protein
MASERVQSMLRDESVIKAIASLLRRAEKADSDQQIASYVDPGIMVLLDNRDHAIVYGRRGTGKTHILGSLAGSLRERPGTFVVEIDCSKLGESKELTGDVNDEVRCYALFQGLLSSVYNQILSQILEVCPERATEAMESLEQLGQIITEPVVRERGTLRSLEESDKSGDDFSLEVGLGTKSGVNIKGKARDNSAKEAKRKTSWDLVSEDNILFPAVQTVLDEFFAITGGSLYVLLDEWSMVKPYELQPYLAEFLKRTLFARKVTVKIAAVEQRSIFSERDKQTLIRGFELGSDITADLVIDAHYVYETNPNESTQRFADIAMRHLRAQLGDYLVHRWNVHNGSELVQRLFRSRRAFAELVRRAEGVVRDFINVFIKAALGAFREGRRQIEEADVVRAARDWYAQDKVSELQEDLDAALRRIVDLVWRRHRTRYFFFPIRQRHWAIDGLFDARLLHLVGKNHFDESSGEYFDVYSIDYGAFSQRACADDGGETLPAGADELVKPFGPKRIAIARVVLPRSALDVERDVQFYWRPVETFLIAPTDGTVETIEQKTARPPALPHDPKRGTERASDDGDSDDADDADNALDDAERVADITGEEPPKA